MTDQKKGNSPRTQMRVRFADAARQAGEFRLSNIKYQVQKLTAQHDAQQKYLVVKAIKEGKDPLLVVSFNLKKAIRKGIVNIRKYFGQTSKYTKPHQSTRECSRRLRIGSPAYCSGIAMNKLASGITHE